MKRLLGPVLYAGGCTDDDWTFHVGVLLDGEESVAPVALEVQGAQAHVEVALPAADFRAVGRGIYWRIAVSVKRTDAEQQLSYRLVPTGAPVDALVPNWVHPVRIPARGELPRIAFFSCNGFSDAKL